MASASLQRIDPSGRVAEGGAMGKRASLEVDDPRFAELLSYSIERLIQVGWASWTLH